MAPEQGRSLRAGILVLSDKASCGERPDASGPALRAFLTEHGCNDLFGEILPDDEEAIAACLLVWADELGLDLILTCGGTGVTPRDVTPEATRRVIEKEIPGLGERMRTAGLSHTPLAMISRALAGTRGRTLIINLPGSPAAAIQNLTALWPAVPHLIAKLQGDPGDCAGDASS